MCMAMEDVARRDEKSALAGLIAVLICPVYAIAVSCALVLLLAIAVHFFSLTPTVIGPVNQVIKVISILLGTTLGLRRAPEKGWMKGIITGILFMLGGLTVYTTAAGEAPTMTMWITDAGMGIVVGAVSGILSVNFMGAKKGRKGKR